ncbi:MAG: hypothetical protein N3F04_05355 [Candidatus Nezhaarchaeota archaeon]|nr:hypothetical protein [Candidatus Nezhaarchaeota archaeon]MCX8142169.1 hypothetical protein [Candidatus Nezhaarchaeota archaeon]MDW8050048.1 hypothetical protein [Nitrososphaerota archaeon]
MVRHEDVVRVHRVLAVMHFLSAVSGDTAVDINEVARHAQPMSEGEVSELLRCCKELGYVIEENGRFYLTYKGVLSALSISS